MTLTTMELAERWKLNKRTLKLWREQGKGPRFLKFGSQVRYSLRDIEDYEQRNKKRSTA